jgi:hypothetical protein
MAEATAAPDLAESPPAIERAAAFRRELRGTALIVAAIVAIVIGGWAGSVLLGRSTSLIGPGISVDFGPGWGSALIGPTNLFSTRRHLGEAELVIAPTFDGQSVDEALQTYRDEVMARETPDASFAGPAARSHAAGAALVQAWTSSGPAAATTIGELVVVVRGGTAVVFDARWPSDVDPSILGELRTVIDSLVIEPLEP